MHYNTHYIDIISMMNKPSYFAVFQFMLDKLLVEKPNNDIIHLSLSQIANECHVYRHGLTEVIDTLERAKLISNVSASKCKNRFQIHVGRLVALISTFHNLKDTEKAQFSEALFTGNESVLKSYGVQETPEMRDIYWGNKGKYLPLVEIGQNEENCTISTNFDKNGLNQPECSKLDDFGQFIDNWTKTANFCESGLYDQSLITQFTHKTGLKRQFLDIIKVEIGQFYGEELDDEALEEVFTNTHSFMCRYPHVKLVVLGLIMDFSLQQNWSKSSNQLVEIGQFLGTVYNNINKKKFGIEDSSKESSSLSKTSFEQDEEIDDEEWEPIKFFQTKVKKKKDYPHFQESEVREWLDHPELCVNDDYKLFLYNLIIEIEIRYHVEEKRDEEGNITREESYDDTPIIEQSTLQEILKSALEFTEEAIQDKQLKLDYEDGEQILPVNIDTFDPDRLLSLLDWEGVNTGANDKELRYQVDWSKINIIDQELIPVIDKTNRTTRRSAESIDQVDDERTLDKEYEKQLFNCENTSQLSPIESIVSTILREYFQQDETGDIVLINHGAFIPRDVLKGYTLQYRESGITLQDIAKVTRRCKLDDHENLSTRAQRMFSALQIQYWNNKHGYQSLIS